MNNSILIDRYFDMSGAIQIRRNVKLELPPVDQNQVTSLSASLAMPAPVNAHDHGYGVRTLGFGSLDDFLEVWALGLQLRPRVDPYLKALVAFARLAAGGVGATMHCHNALTANNLVEEANAVVRAARHIGIHLAFSCPLIDSNPWTYDGPDALRKFMSESEWHELSGNIPHYHTPEEQIALVEEVAKNHHGNDCDIQYGPIGPQWCSGKLLEMIAERSFATGRRVHMHLLESPRQRTWLDARYPQGIISYLDEIGLLSPRLAIAHGVQLRPDECELLAEREVIVVCNPSANLRLRSGIAPVSNFKKSKLPYAIGLDGTGMDDDQDLWREMRLFYLLHGGQEVEREINAEDVFRATIETGSRVVNRTNLSDLVFIDYNNLTNDFLFDDLPETDVILTRMNNSYVRGLIVNNRWVVHNGKLLNINIDECLKELHEQARHDINILCNVRKTVNKIQFYLKQYYI
jgi:cytosine/adenosine deaminase-related metal-dependent hydrolase